MNILNLFRTLLKDSNDTLVSKDDKVNLLKRAFAFYSQEVINKAEVTLVKTDTYVYPLPSDFSSVLSVYNPYSGKTLDTQDYIIDKFEKTLTIVRKVKDQFLGSVVTMEFSDLALQYAKEVTLVEDSFTANIVVGSNTVVVSDISKYFTGAEIILQHDNHEHTVITQVDKVNSTITFNCVHAYSGLITVVCDNKISQIDKDIVAYYACFLSRDLTSTVNETGGSKTSWTVASTQYSTEPTSVVSTSENSYLKKSLELISTLPNSKAKELKKMNTFTFLTLS